MDNNDYNNDYNGVGGYSGDNNGRGYSGEINGYQQQSDVVGPELTPGQPGVQPEVQPGAMQRRPADPQTYEQVRSSYGAYGSYSDSAYGDAAYGGAAAAAAPQPKKRRRPETILGLQSKHFIILVAIIILAMLASGITGGLIAAGNVNTGAPVIGTNSADVTINPSDTLGTTEAVAKKVLDSVVGITSTVTTEGQDFFGFGTGPQKSGGIGTGMIVDKSGYILTNSHVVLDGEVDDIEVLLSDGSTVPGKLLWNEPSLDLAIIKIDPTGKSLKAVELGDSNKVAIGQYVAAIGNPLGLDFNGSITQGVVSGLNRTITAASESTGQATQMEGLIQVDAAINSGNSGGPLLNSEGQVIGVNTAKAQAEGMGFAIPIDTAKPIIESVIANGKFERVYLGVSAADAQTISAQYPKLELGDIKGAFLTSVSSGGPAEKAGLKMKDIITKIDGKAVDGSTSLIKMLLNYKAGDTVTVTYVRSGKESTVKVKLATQAEAYAEDNSGESSSSGNRNGNSGDDDYGYGYGDDDEGYGGLNPFAP
ncbi:MAG: S1C family serine protease [Clostridiales Family XIII bacterium]|jgi:S1-C subfamily serine protease|nr:S1C family serine protease [Clostridiales Family XIII bacterium]